jgi:hypothetical protein
MTVPLVSIIIVNWNGKRLLQSCLESVFNQTFSDYEIILVDNGSTDGSPEYISVTFPDVRLLPLTENRGFTGGNNEGLRHAKGTFIVLLNNDAHLKSDWLENMVAAMNTDPCLGSCASKIIIDGTDILDSVGDIFTTAFTGTKLGELQQQSNFSEPRSVFGPCAAAAIYRRSMLEQIGFFDDDFFLNHEDTDLNMRAWLAGWRCKYIPDAVAYHKVSSSIGNLSDTSVYYFSRNSLWVWAKNVPLSLMLLFLPQRILYELNSAFIFCFVHGKWLPFLRGKRDAIKGLPAILCKRKRVSDSIRLTKREIVRELIPITHYLFQRLVIVLSEVVRKFETGV